MSGIRFFEENILIRNDKPGRKSVIGAVAVIAAALFGIIVTQKNTHEVLYGIIAVMLFAAAMLLLTARSTTIEINRREARLRKVHRIFFLKIKKTFSLHDFSAVKLVARESQSIEGYATLIYSIVLHGKGLSVELLSTGDEEEGKGFLEKFVDFLNPQGAQENSL
ncbi:MAG: hypothetical protein AB1632_14550 [Nitrospirota bacterium]